MPQNSSNRPVELSAESLRWMMGLFCAFVGGFILVAPHRFSVPVFAALRPYAIEWGTLALASGVALLTVAILRPRRRFGLLAHWSAGLALVALAVSFGGVQAWSGVIAYSVFGLGTVAAGFVPRAGSPPLGSGERDLFALLMGMVAVLSGLLLATMPGMIRPVFYGPAYPLIRPLGLILFLAGALLCAVHLRPPRSRRRFWAAHLLAGAVFLGFGAIVAVPLRVWTGIALYWGCGSAVAVLPWLGRGLTRLDPGALRTRLALTLATATSLALILATAVVTTQEEKLAEKQVQAAQQVEAEGIAQNVSDSVEMSSARAGVVAALAGRTPPALQDELLRGSLESYPDLRALRTLDAAGRTIAIAGEATMPEGLLQQLTRETLAGNDPRIRLALVTVGPRVRLLVSSPVYVQGGNPDGVLVAMLDSGELALRMAREGSNVVLNDGHGRLIAQRNAIPAGTGELPSLPEDWDRRFLFRRRLERPPSVIAGFAEVPFLRWVVAVERPRAAALAGVRRGRDFAFGLLLLVVPIAVTGGIVAARRIARPLGTLADAVDQLAAGNPEAPLGTSNITEVARLSAAFREMRDRLAERTQESERLAQELRARAEALAEADRRKDEFLAMLAHELRNPLGAISNASYLMEQVGPADPQLARPLSIIRRQILHLVRMVDDLLDVSRITRGKVELRREAVDLGEVVRHAIESARPEIEAKQHELSVALPQEPLPLEADATRLEQVFSNLLRNAVKFTEPGGRIGVEVRRDGVGAWVRVEDNGIGIDAALLPRVFDLFAQGEQALDRTGAGLGIGLTLVHSLVEMHGGRVEARSDGPGRGSTFTVWLPLS